MRFGGRLAIRARVSLCQRVGEAYYGLSVCGSLLSVAVRALGGMATDARASS